MFHITLAYRDSSMKAWSRIVRKQCRMQLPCKMSSEIGADFVYNQTMLSVLKVHTTTTATQIYKLHDTSNKKWVILSNKYAN